MRTVTVLPGGGETEALLRALTAGRPVRFLPAGGALLLVAPDWRGGALPPTRCRILLTPPDKAALLSAVRARWAVSYGAEGRESLGFSSLRPEGLTLELRRAAPTLAGRWLEAQELLMPCPPGDARHRLAACAAKLLLDTEA